MLLTVVISGSSISGLFSSVLVATFCYWQNLYRISSITVITPAPMRSSVSVILSSPAPDTRMSHPDYDQIAQDHASILILVHHQGMQALIYSNNAVFMFTSGTFSFESCHYVIATILLLCITEGLLKSKPFVKVWDKIRRVNHTKVTDSAGVTRQVYVRYVKEYPVESNDWGDFQTHRRLLGLITVGQCFIITSSCSLFRKFSFYYLNLCFAGQYESQTDLNEICRVHESLKVRYTSTLYDSRCILFGIEDDQLKTPSNFKSLPLWYTDVDSCTDLESQVSELLNSLFWVLESKRQVSMIFFFSLEGFRCLVSSNLLLLFI